MRDCPSDLRLTLFLEGRVSGEAALKIRRHLARCPACAHAAAAGLALQDLETVGALSTVEAREAAGATRRLAELVKARGKEPAAGETPKDPESGLGSRLKGLFGGFVAATGLAEWQGILGPMAHVPGMAKMDKNNLDDAVRKDGLPASSLATENHGNANEEPLTMTGPSPIHPVEHAPTQIGLPGADGRSPWVQQYYEDTCAIRCQELILRDFGVNMPEDVLRREAATNDWYQPGGGTSPRDVGNLLELHGVPVHRYEDATIFNLTSELAQGHKVIVGVDAGELWNKGFLEKVKDQLGLSGANHALLVSGIDTTDPSHVQVVLTDPGSGDVAKVYPLEQFIDAWQDSNCFMVATREPAPLEFNPSMVNFDYALGHLLAIGQLPFDTFQQTFSPYFEYDSHNTLFGDQADLLVDAVNGHLQLDDGQNVEGTIPHHLAGGDSFPEEDAFLPTDDPLDLLQSRELFDNDDSHNLSESEDNTDNNSL